MHQKLDAQEIRPQNGTHPIGWNERNSFPDTGGITHCSSFGAIKQTLQSTYRDRVVRRFQIQTDTKLKRLEHKGNPCPTRTNRELFQKIWLVQMIVSET